MKTPKLIVLGKEVTKENLLQTKQHLEQYGITINIINQEEFVFDILKEDDLGLHVLTFERASFYPSIWRNVTELRFECKKEFCDINSSIHKDSCCIPLGDEYTSRIEILIGKKL